VKRLTLVALGAIVAQGLLGGITVLTKLPPAVSSAHAGLAEMFFALTVSLALFTSPGWARAYAASPRAPGSTQPLAADRGLRRLSVLAIAVVYLQILLGAVMRHTGAGLAIPDFPLMFGRLVPPPDLLASGAVAIHFAHRVCALVLAIFLVAEAWRILRRHGDRPELRRPAALLMALLVLQITLGGLTVLTAKDVIVNTAHLATGALIFATTVVLALRVHRPHFGVGPARASSPGRSVSSMRPTTV
jgi:cytochrome c oxidase assembly protein subunit 15